MNLNKETLNKGCHLNDFHDLLQYFFSINIKLSLMSIKNKLREVLVV